MHNRRVGPSSVQKTQMNGETNMASYSDVEEGHEEITMDSVGDVNDEDAEGNVYASSL